MSAYYNQRHYSGQIAKKPRLGPRAPQLVPNHPHNDDGGKRFLLFKEWILTQSDEVTEIDALARYNDYKTDFIKRQIDKFFKEHQEEEWFRNKYRPTEIKKFEAVTNASKAKRKEIYQQIIQRKLLDDNLQLDYEHNVSVTKFLDNFSFLLEGATLDDVEKGEAPKSYSVSSIFFPNLHPSIDKSMVEEYASNHPGFLRVAMSEAVADKGFKRRAWIIYKQMDHVSLKKLCWEYNAHKFNGHETKAMVNKEMNNRIRYTQFWFCHATAAKSDLKNVAKLLTHFEGEDCPLLETIKEYLIEETNEEEQLLGINEEGAPSFEFTEDPKLMKALDRVVLYLRVVHSFDYYAATEYVGEDDMPQKVGIMFARPGVPTADAYSECPQIILREFIEAHKARIDSFLEKPIISEIDQKQLGKRDADAEIENFIYQHTFEKKAGEKYICKLTKKRFTTAEFVRKHIFNRCGDKLDEIRTEVEFFNNYVADPKRPLGI